MKAKRYYKRGNEYYNAGNFDKAISCYSRALELHPNHKYAKKKLDEAKLKLSELVSLDKDDTKKDKNGSLTGYTDRENIYLKQIELGITSLQQGHITRAVSLFDYATELEPTLPQAYLNRGLVYLHIGYFSTAISDFELAISNDSSYALAYHSLGMVYVCNDDTDEAILYFNQAIKLDPTFANSYYCRGMIYYKQSNYKQACDDFTRSLDIDTENEEAIYMLQKARRHYGEQLAVELGLLSKEAKVYSSKSTSRVINSHTFFNANIKEDNQIHHIKETYARTSEAPSSRP